MGHRRHVGLQEYAPVKERHMWAYVSVVDVWNEQQILGKEGMGNKRGYNWMGGYEVRLMMYRQIHKHHPRTAHAAIVARPGLLGRRNHHADEWGVLLFPL